MKDTVLKVENLWYKYPRGDKWALKDINLEVRKGEFVVLTGPSGCGKSTLALSIVGYIPHVIERGVMKGNVYVKGINTKEKELHELTQLVGIVLQNPEDQLFALTVEEDVAFGPENLALPKEEIRRRIDRAMKDAGVWEIRHKEIFALSGGQKQRTAIAGILAMEPEILIFDEPTSDLDPQGAYAVLSVISEIQEKRDVTVILIEHRLDEVSKYADRIVLMEEGRIIVDAEPHEAYRELDRFLRLGVRPPQVSEAAYKFENGAVKGSVPIDLDEAEKYFLSILGGRAKYPLKLEEPEGRSGEEPIISFQDVWVRYPDGTVAVKGVSLDIYPGEMVAIIGKNGSGKSTLLSLTAGLNKPWKGKAYVAGIDVSTATTRELVQHVGYVFQNPDHQLFTNSVEDELAFGPRNFNVPEEEVKRRVEEALDMLELREMRHMHPQALSRGQRRRLAVASVLTMYPEILVLDEPTTGQDWGHSVMLMELAKRLNRERGMTVIFITHDMRIVAEYAERVVLLHMGKLIMDTGPRAVFNSEEILKYNIYPPYITQLSHRVFEDRPPVLRVEEFIEGVRKAKGGEA